MGPPYCSNDTGTKRGYFRDTTPVPSPFALDAQGYGHFFAGRNCHMRGFCPHRVTPSQK
jgi:hypothetical protein